MPNQYDHKKFAILYVDDEEKSLVSFTRAFGDVFHILTATNAQDGLKLVEQHADEIGILMTDQRMPGEKGVWLLERARNLRPQILRILVTAYTDMDAAIAAVNSGAIYKYVTKPWDPAQLELTLKQGLEFFMVQSERDELLHERMVARRVVSVGLITAGMSQQIRTAMVSVKTFLDLSSDNAGTGHFHDMDFLKKTRLDIEKILNLLADLRIASASQSSVSLPDEIQVQPVFAETLARLQPAFAARRIEVANRMPDTLPLVRADKAKLERLAELLFEYELAMLPAGSRIVLTAEQQGQNVVAQLADNGPALSDESLRMVLDPFAVSGATPREYDIFLMICFFIVHHHGGKMEAQSLPGGGNRFTIRLPLQPEPAAKRLF